MRPLLDRDPLGNHDLLGEGESPSDLPGDLVLGAPALLGIFFALALLCAVFFGFGYSSGHGLHLPGQSAAATTATAAPAAPSNSSAASPSTSPSLQTTAPEDAETGAPPQPSAANLSTQQGSRQPGSAQQGAKPSPDTASSEAPGFPPADAATAAIPAATSAARPAKPSAGESFTQAAPAYRSAALAAAAAAPTSTSTPSRHTAAATQPAAQYRAQAPAQTPAAAPTSAAQTASAPATAPGGSPASLMVQIAAVSRAADAETLATALRHDGFPALVRTSTTDAFFHVQVGPFPTRDAAKAMRARLADSGYNAFIKQ